MTKPVAVDKLLYTPVEAAHALGVGRSTIYVLVANGDVPSVRIGSSRRIPTEDLRRYIVSLSTTGRAAGGHGPKRQHLWD
jgi:excisionase family DNA binding protein